MKTYSAAHFGISGQPIEIETALDNGLPSIIITGMPSEVIRESRERIRACLNRFGFEIPITRTLVHLSPAHGRKQGSQLDLAIATSILLKTHFQSKAQCDGTAFLGELSLDGRIQGISGALSLVDSLDQDSRIHRIIVPRANAAEIDLLKSSKVSYANHFSEVLNYLSTGDPLPKHSPLPPTKVTNYEEPLLDKIQGQSLAKRALQISLAGRHHLCLMGPPGVGKTLIAHAAKPLLPPLSRRELIEVTKYYSYANRSLPEQGRAPFRSPHHSISTSGLLGGGTGTITPGEVTLAHRGVLFLDEFPEFRRDAIEGLREPLQTGVIHLHRIGSSITLDARLTLIVAMNPCPCGFAYVFPKRCRCGPERVAQYQRRVSGPIFDRLDLFVHMQKPKLDDSSKLAHDFVKSSILGAQATQVSRFGEEKPMRNGDSVHLLPHLFAMSEDTMKLHQALLKEESISFRGAVKIVKIARTIADLEESLLIESHHLLEAKLLQCPDGLNTLAKFPIHS